MENQELLDSVLAARGELEITITGADGKPKSKHWYKNTIVTIGKNYIANRLIGGTGNTDVVNADFTQSISSVPAGATAATFNNIVITSGAITSIAVANKGAKYTSTPTVVIRGGNGATGVDARAMAIMEADTTNPGYYRVSSIYIISGGSGYTSGTQAANGTDYSVTGSPPSGTVVSVKLVGGFEKRVVSYMAIGQTNDSSLVPAAPSTSDLTLANELYRNQLTFVQYPNTLAAAADQKKSILFTCRFGPYDSTNGRLTGPSASVTIKEAGIFNAPAGLAADAITDTQAGGDMLCRTTFGAIVKDPSDTVDIRWTITIQ